MTAWLGADDIKRNFQWAWILDNQQGAKADTKQLGAEWSWKVQSPGSGYNPIPTEIWAAAALQNTIAEK